jgi:hypothetical protein
MEAFPGRCHRSPSHPGSITTFKAFISRACPGKYSHSNAMG